MPDRQVPMHLLPLIFPGFQLSFPAICPGISAPTPLLSLHGFVNNVPVGLPFHSTAGMLTDVLHIVQLLPQVLLPPVAQRDLPRIRPLARLRLYHYMPAAIPA